MIHFPVKKRSKGSGNFSEMEGDQRIILDGGVNFVLFKGTSVKRRKLNPPNERWVNLIYQTVIKRDQR